MQNTRYDYSSLHLDVPDPLASELILWGRENVNDNEIYVSQKEPSYGREDEIHVTILYGLHCESTNEIKPIITGKNPIRIQLDLADIFVNAKFDVLMINVISPDLQHLNRELQQNLAFTNPYSKYQPHITIAYVKKGRTRKYRGLDLWQNRTFVCNYAVFSSKKGTKEKIFF